MGVTVKSQKPGGKVLVSSMGQHREQSLRLCVLLILKNVLKYKC